MTYAIDLRFIKIVRFLIENGADINAKDGSGLLPINQAISLGKIRILDLLLKNGAKITLNDESGVNAIEFALRFKKKNAFKMVLFQSIHDQ